MEFLKILDDIKATYPGGAPGSISRVSMLERCPFQWKCQYVDRIKGVDAEHSIDTKVGSFAHAVAEKHMLVGSRNKYSKDPAMFAHSWDYIATVESLKFPEEVVAVAKERLYDKTKNVLDRIFDSVNQYAFSPKTELRISYTLNHEIRPFVNWKNVLWCSIVDLCLLSEKDKFSILVDYKSHSSVNDTESMSEKEKRQINTYALFTMLLYPNVNTVQQRLAYLGDEVIKLIDVATRDNFFTLLEDFTEYLDNYRTLLRTTQYEPRETDYCKWCGFTQQCELK